MGMVERGKRPKLEKIPSNIPASLKTIMTKCWEQKPNKRPMFDGELNKIIMILVQNNGTHSFTIIIFFTFFAF